MLFVIRLNALLYGDLQEDTLRKKPDAYVATITRVQPIASGKCDTWEESIVLHELTTMEDIHNWVAARTGFSGNYATEVRIRFSEVKND